VEHLDIPVIGSLNGVSAGGWVDYATAMQGAGAAIMRKVYFSVGGGFVVDSVRSDGSKATTVRLDGRPVMRCLPGHYGATWRTRGGRAKSRRNAAGVA